MLQEHHYGKHLEPTGLSLLAWGYSPWLLNPILLSLKTLPVWQDAWACRQTCFSWRFCWPSPPSNPNPGPHCSDSYPPPPSWLGSCQHQGCSSSHQMNYMNSVSNSPSSKVSHLWRENWQISERTFLLQVTHFSQKLPKWRQIASPQDQKKAQEGQGCMRAEPGRPSAWRRLPVAAFTHSTYARTLVVPKSTASILTN